MDMKARIKARFEELESSANQVQPVPNSDGFEDVDGATWQKWSTSALSLLNAVFGTNSVHVRNFQRIYDHFRYYHSHYREAKAVFLAAKEDFCGGYLFALEKTLAGEILGDFVALAKLALAEGQKDVAVVLACSALEDALKRYARSEGLDVEGASMQKVISALKSKALVSGAQNRLLDAMPKVRDLAMHANWEKLAPEDAGSVIGFVEQFLLSHFSGT